MYVDNHLLILEKPAGIATQPDFHERAKSWLKKAFAKPGDVFLEPIHRLDQPVSGIVLFARTSKALSRLNASMRKGDIQKFYLGWVEGVIQEKGTLKHYLRHGSHKAEIDPQGKLSILHFHRQQVHAECSLVEITLETGRYHQIRKQFSEIGHPICGDVKYGAKKERRLFLHHHKIIFPHPIKGEECCITTSQDLCFSLL